PSRRTRGCQCRCPRCRHTKTRSRPRCMPLVFATAWPKARTPLSLLLTTSGATLGRPAAIASSGAAVAEESTDADLSETELHHLRHSVHARVRRAKEVQRSRPAACEARAEEARRRAPDIGIPLVEARSGTR